jgi:hypothetical protein
MTEFKTELTALIAGAIGCIVLFGWAWGASTLLLFLGLERLQRRVERLERKVDADI